MSIERVVIKRTLARLVVVVTVVQLLPRPSEAQQVTGTPGSPSATTTIDGKYVPTPSPRFGGVINMDVKNSKPYWPPTFLVPTSGFKTELTAVA
jgi:hypothetical protein